MKVISLLLSSLISISPLSVCEDKQTGFLVDSDRPSIVCVHGNGDNYKENISIDIDTFGNKINIIPQNDSGYQPKVFIGNFLDNGLEEMLYSVESGGSGGYSFYEMYSLKNGESNLIFNSNDFSPIISAQYIGKDIIEIDYQSKKLYMSYSNEGCIDNNCDINISPVNAILPFYNISLNRYYLQVLQKVYGGYSANNFGYVVSMLQINEDGYDVINIGVLSNFEYINA